MLDKNKDLLVIIDMINGFSYEGAFASENVVAMIDPLTKFTKEQLANGVEVIHYTDWHQENSQEFGSYPVHCLENSHESLPVEPLTLKEIEIIKKNSTNGFFAKNPFDYQKNIYITGCVTDICIFEYALTAQKYKEEFALPYTVNVISDLVTTFDGPDHDANKVNQKCLEILKSRGVNIIVSNDL